MLTKKDKKELNHQIKTLETHFPGGSKLCQCFREKLKKQIDELNIPKDWHSRFHNLRILCVDFQFGFYENHLRDFNYKDLTDDSKITRVVTDVPVEDIDHLKTTFYNFIILILVKLEFHKERKISCQKKNT